jgi:hypothetical protein
MAKRPIKRISSRFRAGAKVLPATLALVALAAAPAAAAAPSPAPVAFALSPVGTTTPIILDGVPGRVLHGAVLVQNVSGHPITVIVQPADIENSSNGNAEFVTTRLSRTGRWLALSTGRVRLAPHASRRVAYTVTVPTGAIGGAHYAGIVAINAADLVTPTARKHSTGRAFSFHRISREALPLTVHLPGALSRSLSLRSAKLIVQPIGAGLLLGLVPGGNELTQGARVNLRLMRGARTVLANSSTLGQLFPGGGLSYRIAWPGRPTPGTYRLLGTIRPQGSAAINVDRVIRFTAAKASQLKRETPPVAQVPGSATPGWMWLVLAGGAALLLALSLTVWKLARRPRAALT